MDSQFPLRHLPLISENPSTSPSLSPALSDGGIDVLEAEVKIDQLQDHNYSAAVLLRSFLDHLGEAGKKAFLYDMKACADEKQKLVDFASHLLDAVLKPSYNETVKLAGGKAPSPLTDPPTLDATEAIERSMATIETSSRMEQKDLRAECLRRDGYRCVCTGRWDTASLENGLVVPPSGAMVDRVECAHIIPFAMGSFDDSDPVQTHNKAIIWFDLHRYFPELCDKIDARTINKRTNAMMLSAGVHQAFGNFKLALLPRGNNAYTVEQYLKYPMVNTPTVQFTSHDDTVPMPDEDFLKVHYIISQILQVSGFGRQIDVATCKAEVDLGCHGLHPSGCTDAGGILSRILLTMVRVDDGFEEGSDHGAEKLGMMP